MKKRVLWRALALLLAVCLLPVPARATDDNENKLPIKIVANEVLNGEMTLKVKKTAQLKVEHENGGTIAETMKVTWTSDNEGVATVGESDGLVTAEGAGIATITANVAVISGENTGKTGTATCRVTVTAATVAGVTVSLKELTLEVGGKETLSANVTMDPLGEEAPQVAWSSDDTAVALVHEKTGLVTAVAPGQTTIWAAAGDKRDSCRVTVQGLTLSPETLSLVAGSTGTLTRTLHGLPAGTACRWTSNDNTVARVDETGQVTAVAAGNCTITVRTEDGKYEASARVAVRDNTAGVIRATAGAGQPLSLSGLAGEIDSNCRNILGNSLSYVTGLFVPTSQGVLHYGYVSVDDTGAGVASRDKYYYSAGAGQLRLANITFVPKADFSGTAVIQYTGYNAGDQYFTGEIRVEVAQATGVTYSTGVNTPVTFAAEDFSAICRSLNGRDARYVRFTLPASRYGTLYYNYSGSGDLSSAVEAGTSYYVSNNPYLNKVTFVPAQDTTGAVTIAYTGIDTGGYTFRGQVTIYVTGAAGGGGDIRYEVGAGEEAEFRSTDFNSLSREVTGYSLDYVRFTLPSSSEGTLYYNYTSSSNYGSKVAAGTRYYRSGTPALSQVSFVPARGYTGTVEIPFTGYDTQGESFSGAVVVAVDDSDSVVRYRTRTGQAVEFDEADFNAACREQVGEALNYVRFTLPASSRGTLYYDYDGSSASSAVSASTSYYRGSGTRRLSRVSFVPKSGFSGTVTIAYTGWSVGGARYTGTVEVEVTDATARSVYYTTTAAPVALRAEDFNRVCDALTGRNLTYVRFTLPYSAVGSLYYDYVGPSQYGAEVRAATSYYRSGTPELSRVTFVPRAGFQGTASIAYTGRDASGNDFQGTVEILVTAAPVTSTFRDMGGHSWAQTAVEYLHQTGVVNGISAGNYGPALSISRGDFALMLCRAFGLNSGGAAGFSDVPAGSYYAGAVATVRDLGIAQGRGDNRFYPADPVTRQDAMVMIQRALGCVGLRIPDGSAATLSRFSDGGSVAAYARGAVAAMVEEGIMKGDDAGRLNPAGRLTRAEMAVVLYQVLTQYTW